MELWLVIAVLVAALLHASWNALVKVGGDGVLTFFLFKLGGLPFAGAVLLFTVRLRGGPPCPAPDDFRVSHHLKWSLSLCPRF